MKIMKTTPQARVGRTGVNDHLVSMRNKAEPDCKEPYNTVLAIKTCIMSVNKPKH
jgi:hypothetical protein